MRVTKNERGHRATDLRGLAEADRKALIPLLDAVRCERPGVAEALSQLIEHMVGLSHDHTSLERELYEAQEEVSNLEQGYATLSRDRAEEVSDLKRELAKPPTWPVPIGAESKAAVNWVGGTLDGDEFRSYETCFGEFRVCVHKYIGCGNNWYYSIYWSGGKCTGGAGNLDVELVKKEALGRLARTLSEATVAKAPE